MRWLVVLSVGWACLLVFSASHQSLPASWWMDVTVIDVVSTDDPDGCLPMHVERTINRPFKGHWTVTIMRQRSDGRFYTYNTFRGSNDYRPENSLPDDLDLCWWTWSQEAGVPFDQHRISFEPGTYRIHTLWKLDVDGGQREIRRTSPTFTIEGRV